MIKNYFKIAWRSVLKNKLYSFINFSGLAIGITCCILIGEYIVDEISYDKFNINANRIARVTMEYSSGGTVNQYAQTGTKVGPQFKRSFPEIEDFTRLMKFQRVISYRDKLFSEKNFLYADPSFFRIFSFPFVEGNPSDALSSTDKIVLTQSAAKKYFGNDEAIGKIVKVNDRNFSVSAVVKDVPGNSQIQFAYVIAFNNLDAAATEQWWTANYITYLLLHNKDDINKVQQKITAYMKTGSVRQEYGAEGSDYLTYHIEPFTWVHMHSALDGLEPNGSIIYIYILGVIALLILAIACVNYTNLSTAQAAGRSAEIGIRKVMGALRYQLFAQFISESLLITSLAAIAALLLSTQLFPLFNSITGKHLSGSMMFQPMPLLYIFLGILFIGFAAGVYPSLILSGTVIIKILKAGFSLSSSGKGVRKWLIMFQFVISVFLIIATIIILQQINYIRNKNLGYDKEHILELPIESRVSQSYYAIKKQVSLLPQVQSVSGAYSSPVLAEWGDDITTDNGYGKIKLPITAIPVDLDFIKTLNMKILAGSDYTMADLQQLDESNKNNNPQYAYMLNETALKKIGWSLQQAIGKTISVSGSRPGVVKAVVKDFNFQSMHEPIGPLMIFLDTQWVRNMFVKVSGSNISNTVQQIEKIWKDRVPYRPFEYRFLDDEFESLYKTEQHTAQLFSIFSGLAILLACLGLFGLTAFTTVQRTKEIGIRKVLGANVTSIVSALSKDFMKLVLLAFMIASPVAYYFMHQWLGGFAYRISISWLVFAVAGIAALLIALVTVCFHAIKAAIANPVKSLRTE
ncbi:MAG: ABC transporter permease [Chitinophagales bacterium]